jgi:hypothetical protein
MKFLKNITRVMAFAIAAPLVNAAPLVMNYEGQFETTNGVAITEPIDLEFSFYDEPIGGERYANFVDLDEDVVPSNGGYVTTFIGDDPGNPIPRIVFFKDEVYLNIRVNGENLTPRKRMTSVGFSINSSDSRSANAVSESFLVGEGSEIEEGDVVSIDPTTSFVYAGFCPEYENGVLSPLNEANYRTLGPNWIFGEKEGFIVLGILNNNQLSFTNTALFSVIQNMENIHATYLSSSTFILSYYDPNDKVYVGKKCTVSRNTLTVDNNNILLFGQGSNANSYGIVRLTDDQIVIQYPDGENGPTVRARVNVGSAFDISDSAVISNSATSSSIFTSINTLLELENGLIQSLMAETPEGEQVRGVVTQFTTNNPYPENFNKVVVPGFFLSNFRRFGQNNSIILSPFTSSTFIITSNGQSISVDNLSQFTYFEQNPNIDVNSILYISANRHYNKFSYEYINNLLSSNYTVTYRGYSTCNEPFIFGDQFISYDYDGLFAVVNPALQPVSPTRTLGIAIDSGDSNENIRVAVQGIVSGYQNLVPGQRYAPDYSGRLIRDEGVSEPFLAITPDKILIDRR